MTRLVCRIQGETMEGTISATPFSQRLAWRRRGVLSLLFVKRLQISCTWYGVKRGNIRIIILGTAQAANLNLGAELRVQNYFSVDFKTLLRLLPCVGCGPNRLFPICGRLDQGEV